MKIAYISLHWPRSTLSSVGNKINMQINNWRNSGHDVRLFMHTHTDANTEALLEGEIFEYGQKNGLIFREYKRILALRSLMHSVKRFRPNLIYLRYGVYIFGLQQLKNIAPVCIEINTNDQVEHRRLGKAISFYNKITRGITLNNASAFVFESQALIDETCFSKFRKTSTLIGNGIDLSRIDPLPAPNNPTPRLVFVGTAGFSWHGVDKLEILATRFPDLHIDVIGYECLTQRKKSTEKSAVSWLFSTGIHAGDF